MCVGWSENFLLFAICLGWEGGFFSWGREGGVQRLFSHHHSDDQSDQIEQQEAAGSLERRGGRMGRKKISIARISDERNR